MRSLLAKWIDAFGRFRDLADVLTWIGVPVVSGAAALWGAIQLWAESRVGATACGLAIVLIGLGIAAAIDRKRLKVSRRDPAFQEEIVRLARHELRSYAGYLRAAPSRKPWSHAVYPLEKQVVGWCVERVLGSWHREEFYKEARKGENERSSIEIGAKWIYAKSESISFDDISPDFYRDLR